jgi:hypothetical protein
LLGRCNIPAITGKQKRDRHSLDAVINAVIRQ